MKKLQIINPKLQINYNVRNLKFETEKIHYLLMSSLLLSGILLLLGNWFLGFVCILSFVICNFKIGNDFYYRGELIND